MINKKILIIRKKLDKLDNLLLDIIKKRILLMEEFLFWYLFSEGNVIILIKSHIHFKLQFD